MTYQSTYLRLRLPVWASEREVIRAARRKLKPTCRRSRHYREARHAYLRDILNCHREAGALARAFRL